MNFMHFLLARFPSGNLEHSFVATSYLTVCSVSGCCLRSTENWILREILRLLVLKAWFNSGYMFCNSTVWTNLHKFPCDGDSNPEVSFFVLRLKGEVAQSMSQVA